MAGNETTPGAVQKTQYSNMLESVLSGPLTQQFVKQPDFPFAKDRIKAIWRNEIGDAA
jgi:hypothetical protein